MAQKPDPITTPMAGIFNARGDTATKDHRIINAVVEHNTIGVGENSTSISYVNKRSGTSQINQPSGGAAAARGVYYWAETDTIYSVFGNTLYAGTTSIQTLNTSTGRVGFVENGGGTKYLVVVDGADGWYVNTSDTVAQITDPQYPAATTSFVENIDGYTVVVNTADGGLYSSELDDPTDWQNDFVNPEMYPDQTTALTRYRNMLVAFGRISSEFFYNAANTSGSPFNRVQQYAQEIGIAEPDTLARVKDTIFFVGQDKVGLRRVYTIQEESFVAISEAPLDRILESEGTSISSADGMIVNLKGQTCYLLSLSSADRTFCYCIESGRWTEITDTSGSAKWDYIYSDHDDKGTSIVQHRTDGYVYRVDKDVFQDNSTNFPVVITTNKYDFGTQRRKFFNGINITGDRQPSSTILYVSYSDDDYQNFGTERQVDMSGRMFLRNLGSGRRRAYKFRHEDNADLRLEGMEHDIDLGVY